jgi:hypothetical protein
VTPQHGFIGKEDDFVDELENHEEIGVVGGTLTLNGGRRGTSLLCFWTFYERMCVLFASWQEDG